MAESYKSSLSSFLGRNSPLSTSQSIDQLSHNMKPQKGYLSSLDHEMTVFVSCTVCSNDVSHEHPHLEAGGKNGVQCLYS